MKIIIIYTYLTFQLRHDRTRAKEDTQHEAGTWKKREDPETDIGIAEGSGIKNQWTALACLAQWTERWHAD